MALDQTIRLCLMGKDSGLAEAMGRALGEGFGAQHIGDFDTNKWSEWKERCDVVLLDFRAEGGSSDGGFALIEEIRRSPNRPPVIVLCHEEERSLTAQLLECGAYDTITSPPNIVELRLILQRAHKMRAAERELERLRASARSAGKLHDLIGTSASMQELFALAQKIGPCDVNVLITGETGTGKELLARAIHQMSPRASRPLVAFSCANLPETLVEDELFGHEKGAFTGALMSRRGRLETADQGTLFLDEIGDLGLGLQPKFLRVLQERKFERLGTSAATNVNIRLICATNRDLSAMVQAGTFREDLYYRLNVVQMHLPPLRERRDDIPVLAQHFLQIAGQQFNKKVKRFSQLALHALEEYSWPGNVRELENTVQRAVVLSESGTVDVWHLPKGIRSTSEEPTLSRSYEDEVRQFKRRLLLRTLQECGWRKAESARTLGVARGYLHRLINQLELRQPDEDFVPAVNREKLPVRQFN
ncbi:MAG: sigma-54 dependent transcriptional regulator [Candidatus Acidiferrales bacterium]